jgi:hypothetical protein
VVWAGAAGHRERQTSWVGASLKEGRDNTLERSVSFDRQSVLTRKILALYTKPKRRTARESPVLGGWYA